MELKRGGNKNNLVRQKTYLALMRKYAHGMAVQIFNVLTDDFSSFLSIIIPIDIILTRNTIEIILIINVLVIRLFH